MSRHQKNLLWLSLIIVSLLALISTSTHLLSSFPSSSGGSIRSTEEKKSAEAP